MISYGRLRRMVHSSTPRYRQHNTAASSATLDLHISISITCICDLDAIPPIPNSEVAIFRPSVTFFLRELTTIPSSIHVKESSSSIDADVEELAEKAAKSKLWWVAVDGSVGVCVRSGVARSGGAEYCGKAGGGEGKGSRWGGVAYGAVCFVDSVFHFVFYMGGLYLQN